MNDVCPYICSDVNFKCVDRWCVLLAFEKGLKGVCDAGFNGAVLMVFGRGVVLTLRA